MKKILSALLFLMLLLLFAGCGPKIQLPDDPVVFDTKENDGYLSIVWGDREYVPFSAFNPSQLGECIGYYEDAQNRSYICTVKGQSPKEWIVSVLGLENCDEGMIFREKCTTTIPNGFSSEYEWNK